MSGHALLHKARPLSPPYTVRVSRRARRMWLRVSRWGSVEVVVPARHSAAGIARFVADNRAWIERTQKEFAREYGPAPKLVLPTRLVLRATGETWTVQFRHAPGGRPRLREMPGRLVIEGGPKTPDTWRPLLSRWLQRHARDELVPWLAAAALDIGVRYRRVQVRGQRTRWGSCSSAGTISLNYSLLFLPPRLVRYLLVHELCHLRHLDHSPRFWARVEAHAPQWRRLERELREARRLVPDWLDL